MSTSGESADLAGRLEGVRVLVLVSRGTPDAQVRGAVGALHGAGAELIGLWWLTDRWSLDDDAQRRGLAGWLGLDGDDPDRVRAEVARRLADGAGRAEALPRSRPPRRPRRDRAGRAGRRGADDEAGIRPSSAVARGPS